MSRALALVARDPRTYRRQTLELSAAWDETTDAETLSRYIAEVVGTMARKWRTAYGVSMPAHRVEWSIEERDNG